jgi:chitinase
MKRIIGGALVFFASLPIFAQVNTCKEVVGYYPNWQWYDRNKLVNPQTIDYSKYSILNYSFFEPLSNGTIRITDPWADKNLLLGPINWAMAPAGYDTGYDFGNPAYHFPGQKMSDYCHQNGVKLLPSIGGWTLSQNFPLIAASSATRQAFAQSCVDLIIAFNFDGIDLDWEYPGFSDHGGTPQDKQNFTLLLTEIRSAIDAYGQSVGKDLLLTIAVSADPSKMDDVEWHNVEPLVDMINLMSYDFFGAFDSFTNHNSPLFQPLVGNSAFNADAAVDNLLTVYNVDPQKINLGIAFYGRSQTTSSAPQLHMPSNGQADMLTFQPDEGTPLYYNVLLKEHLFTKFWDDNAKVPYLLGNSGLNTFLSYDDEQSVGLKAQYVVDKNLKGAIIWEITGDYLETSPGSGIISHTPLVDSINAVFCNYVPADTTNSSSAYLNEIEFVSFSIFPNPSNDFITITSSDEILALEILTSDGKFVEHLNGQLEKVVSLDITSYPAGLYFVNLSSSFKKMQSKFIVH